MSVLDKIIEWSEIPSEEIILQAKEELKRLNDREEVLDMMRARLLEALARISELKHSLRRAAQTIRNVSVGTETDDDVILMNEYRNIMTDLEEIK